MITHYFTAHTTKQLIELRGAMMATKKFQPILTPGCDNTISQINSELLARGIKPLR
jgi:hypothetical protein